MNQSSALLKTLFFFVCAVWVSPVLGGASVFGSASESPLEFASDSEFYSKHAILIQFHADVSVTQKDASFSKIQGLKSCDHQISPFFSRCVLEQKFKKTKGLKTNVTQVRNKILNQIRSRSEVAWAEIDQVHVLDLPSQSVRELKKDPEESKQWNLEKTGWTQELFQGRKGEPVILAIADNAIDIDHPELRNRVALNEAEIPGNGIDDDGNGFVDDVEGWDFYQFDNNPRPEFSESHGTHVAGIAMAEAGNGIGISGIAALSTVRLLPIKVSGFERSDATMTSLFVLALDYARIRGAKVFSLSYPISGESRILQAALQRARDAGMIFVNSAGNNAESIDQARGKLRGLFDHVIFVAASDVRDQRADFSNYGKTVEIAAPGHEVLSLLPRGRYGLMSGTSMAAPHVSGALAVLRSLYPEENPRAILDQLLGRTQLLPPWDRSISGGRLWLGNL